MREILSNGTEGYFIVAKSKTDGIERKIGFYSTDTLDEAFTFARKDVKDYAEFRAVTKDSYTRWKGEDSN